MSEVNVTRKKVGPDVARRLMEAGYVMIEVTGLSDAEPQYVIDPTPDRSQPAPPILLGHDSGKPIGTSDVVDGKLRIRFSGEVPMTKEMVFSALGDAGARVLKQHAVGKEIYIDELEIMEWSVPTGPSDVESVCREWMKGCSCAPKDKPWECVACTEGFHRRLMQLTGAA